LSTGIHDTQSSVGGYQRHKGNYMEQKERLKYLKFALTVFGIIFIAGIYVMMMWVWPEGWGWTPRQPEYEQMIMGVYATLGVFLILAAKDPLANASLIWFTIWSSIVHGGIMLVQAIVDETERANLLGDIPALFLVAFVLWYLMPRKSRA
jgi:sterol desaturase/sphingolipid hydroxylase (fatty acid hydroxylase superfamily)